MNKNKRKIMIFDTTMRDGELTPGVTMNLSQKMEIAKVLEAIKVDVIEVGYPGINYKDIKEISTISREIKKSIVCGLTGSNKQEINILGEALKDSIRGRINIFTNVNTVHQSKLKPENILEKIAYSIDLAKNYCDDIQWTAFDAIRSDFKFLVLAIETAIRSGANTICIPDTMGSAKPDEFASLIKQIYSNTNNIDPVTVAIHCHDDRGLALANSLAAMEVGASQIECSMNGLGARKGNTNLNNLAHEIINYPNYEINLKLSSLDTVSKSIAKILNTTE